MGISRGIASSRCTPSCLHLHRLEYHGGRLVGELSNHRRSSLRARTCSSIQTDTYRLLERTGTGGTAAERVPDAASCPRNWRGFANFLECGQSLPSGAGFSKGSREGSGHALKGRARRQLVVEGEWGRCFGGVNKCTRGRRQCLVCVAFVCLQ